MTTRVMSPLTREDSTHSEGEKSFASAESRDYIIADSDGQSASSTPLSPQFRFHKADAPTNISQITNIATDKSRSIKNHINSEVSNQSRASLPLSRKPYFSQQPRAGGIEPRSPQSRRPPASRSSHGIATKAGPPPALITRRTYAQSPGRITPPVDVKGLSRNSATNIDSIVTTNFLPANVGFESSRVEPRREASVRPSTSDGVMMRNQGRGFGYAGNEDNDSTLRVTDHTGQRDETKKDRISYRRSHDPNEDLFLDLARDTSTNDGPATRSERRRSHFSNTGMSQTRVTRPSSSGRPYTSGDAAGKHKPSEFSFDSILRPSPPKAASRAAENGYAQNRSYAASAHPLGGDKRTSSNGISFGSSTSVQEQSPEIPMPYGRRRSIREASPGGVLNPHILKTLSQPMNRQYESQTLQGTSPLGQGINQEAPQRAGTESTVSTTAPSTVWDELDDLKSRLRKLELTGTLPKSSDAAITNVLQKRPNTATTTMTTISSSPKHRQIDSLSPEAPITKSQGLLNLHPLLHTALAKAEYSLSPSLYNALETTASDALTLAAMTASTGSRGGSPSTVSINGPAQSIDKQLRRKADSMCRSLTELCIALAEDGPDSDATKSRSRSVDTNSTEMALPKPRLLHLSSDESETRSSSRVMTRLEARRASLLASSPLNGRRGSAQELATPPQTVTPLTNRTERAPSQYLRDQSNGEGCNASSRPRPPSRAATEIGKTRPSPQTRISREYTSQHPMPTNAQPSPVTQSAIPPRKSYFVSATSSPLTPNVQPGNRRYMDRSTPPSSADSARLVEARQRRIASLGQSQSRIGISSTRFKPSQAGQQG